MTEQWKTEFSPAQSECLRQWGADRHLESKSDILRELVRSYFRDDFPDDMEAPGGNREGRRPNVGEQVRVLRDTETVAEGDYPLRKLRAGARGVVEGRTRRGVVVAFAGAGFYDSFMLIRYRDVEIVPFGE